MTELVKYENDVMSATTTDVKKRIYLTKRNYNRWKNLAKNLSATDDEMFELFFNSYNFELRKTPQIYNCTTLQCLNSQRLAHSHHCDFRYKIDSTDNDNSYLVAHTCVLEACLGCEFLQYVELLPQNINDNLEDACSSVCVPYNEKVFKVPPSFQNIVQYCYTGYYCNMGDTENYVNVAEIQWLVEQLVDDTEVKIEMKKELAMAEKLCHESTTLCVDFSESDESDRPNQNDIMDDEDDIDLNSSNDLNIDARDMEDYIPSNDEDDEEYAIELERDLFLDDEELDVKIASVEENSNDSGASLLSYKCSLCNEMFASKTILTKHFKDKHFESLGKQTRSKTLRNRDVNFFVLCHSKIKKPDTEFECCGEIFLSRFRYSVHLLHEHTAVFVSCSECDEQVKLHDLNTHYYTLHNFPSQPETDGLENSDEFNSNKIVQNSSSSDNEQNCRDKEKEQEALKKSSAKNLWRKKIKCFPCQKVMTIDSYVTHLNEQEQCMLTRLRCRQNSYKLCRCLSFQCLLCEKNGNAAEKRNGLWAFFRHISQYHFPDSVKDEEVSCGICGAKVLKFHLKRHQSLHNQTMVSCDVCGKSVRKRALSKHRQCHSESAKSKCPYCSKMFSSIWNRRVHERIHTGVKPYVCNICGKGFRQNVELRLHGRQHDKEKLKVTVPEIEKEGMQHLGKKKKISKKRKKVEKNLTTTCKNKEDNQVKSLI